MSLSTQDFLLTLLHLLIIGFNLLGWIPRAARKLHFWFTMATLFCWLVLGIWYGIGYCPITDWQWQIKTQLGEVNLPGSFVKYFADEIFNSNFNTHFIDAITLLTFAISIGLSIKLNFYSARPRTYATR